MNKTYLIVAAAAVAGMLALPKQADAKWWKKVIHAVENAPSVVVHETVQAGKAAVSKAGDAALDATKALPVPVPGRGLVRQGFHEVIGK